MKNIKLEEMQEIERNILKYIDKICQENKIEYTVVGGTAIGAIRHNGFIPWDDDIDIGLTPENYDKLLKCIKEDDDERYKLLHYKNENTYKYPFAKVVDTRTTLVEDNQIPINNYGIFVDVFKYFGMPNNKVHRFFYYYKIKIYNKYNTYMLINKLKAKNILVKILKCIMRLRAKQIGIDKILEKFEKEINKYPIETSKYCTSNWPLAKRKNQILESDIFNNGTIRHEFDNIEVNIMKEYDKYLTNAYGNYMELPPIEKQKPPHPSNASWK